MYIVYFALWVVLNGRWTLEIGAFGLVFAALLYAFSCRFMGYSVQMDIRLARRVLAAIRYGVLLLREILKANMNVMRIILSRDFEPRPQLVRFSSGLKRDYHRVVLADSITLTPGTITCMLEGDDFVVHCLDASMMDGLDDGDMPRALHRMETDRLAAMDKDAALPVAETAHSLELGMIRCIDEIRERVRQETGLSLTDAQIEQMLAGQPCSLSDEVRGVFDRMVAADDAIEQLRAERQVDAVMAARREAAETEERR